MQALFDQTCPPVQKDLLLVFSGSLFVCTVLPRVFAAAQLVWDNPLVFSVAFTALVAGACRLLPEAVYAAAYA
jgi:hypothetical protein